MDLTWWRQGVIVFIYSVIGLFWSLKSQRTAISLLSIVCNYASIRQNELLESRWSPYLLQSWQAATWPLESSSLLSTPLMSPCSTPAGSAHLETTRNEPTTSSREIFISFLVLQLTNDEQGDISVIKSADLSLGQWGAEKKHGRALKRVFPLLSKSICGLF